MQFGEGASSRVEFTNRPRGLAVVAVVVSHFAGIFWFNPATVSTLTNLPGSAFDTPTSIPVGFKMLNALRISHWGRAFGVFISAA
ncbi:MAG TPA: hypothetical protein VKT76_14755 [Bradyrhizobium sp.]|nr:hypothetical protein [Bradyrhizobium sp.]